MTNASTVGASKRRETIPNTLEHNELGALEEMTSAELAWRGDHHEDLQTRAWARWELEHREATGLFVDIGPDGRLRRLEVTEETAARIERERTSKKLNRAQYNARGRALAGMADRPDAFEGWIDPLQKTRR